jgi:translation initiation factor IF-2
MSDTKAVRLSKLAREFNVGITTIVDFLKHKGIEVDSNPNSKVTPEAYDLLMKEYSNEKTFKKESEKISLRSIKEKTAVTLADVIDKSKEGQSEQEDVEEEVFIKDTGSHRAAAHHETPAEIVPEPPPAKLAKKTEEPKIIGKIDLDTVNKTKTTRKAKKAEEPEAPAKPVIEKVKPIEKAVEEKPKAKKEKLVEPETAEKNEVEVKVVGKIDLDSMNMKTRPSKKSKKVEKEEKTEEVVKEKPSKPKLKKVIKAEEAPIIEPVIIPEPETEPEPIAEDLENIDEPLIVEPEEDINFIKADYKKLVGPTVIGKMTLPEKPDKKKPVASSSDTSFDKKKKKRRRIKSDNQPATHKKDEFDKINDILSRNKKPTPGAGGNTGSAGTSSTSAASRRSKRKILRPEISEEDVQKQIKDTLARLTTKGKSKGSKYRREKRDAVLQRSQESEEKKQADKNVLHVTEFVSVNELASMMNVQVTEVISVCMNMGLFVSINQRLDAETLVLVADEFQYKVEFISVDLQESITEDHDVAEDLLPRPPIVTVMGHVDHGKTKLLDYIRHTNVIAGEAGGITQHIGAYGVQLDDGRKITFLDTPGHEAFTAMRARGAQITDVVIIVVAADDGVMPQTVEAINHAQAAGVPIVFAINKIDKPTSNPERIKEQLAKMNLLVEDWGGKYQSQEISAKSGLGIDNLLEKVLLEAELLDLKANPNKNARGTVIESMLDKGRGYIATILVESGTLRAGDVLLAGASYGHVKALFNERGKKIDVAGPAFPTQILGLNGAPQAGDKFHVMDTDKEAKEIANRREQLQREQELRTKKHITLDEIGRRIAIGNFQELNVIVKGDVDGSVEALSDSLIKLSTPEIQVNVIHKAVGQISESDILLAAASNAIIIGFQVRPSYSARKLAEKEQIDVRLYSIIYDAINELKDAMEGMLSPEMKEEIVATLEILEVFKITKVGTVAGCIVRDGKLTRNTRVRVIRDGIVVYTGNLESLKRFKEDVREVVSGFECGLNIENFNDIKVNDIIEGYQEVEVKKKL